MRKLVFALGLLMMGGMSLSAASAASVLPAAAPVSKAVKAQGDWQPVHYRNHRRHYGGYYRHSDYGRRHYGYYNRHRGFFFHGSFIFYPYGYYPGFCYDYPRDPWCGRYFYDRY